jgi:putative colanic acid biosynthesis acetyltransferase WcaF
MTKPAQREPREGGATYTLSHRLFRIAWGAAWAVFASWTPPPLVGWRRFLLRLFGARVAKTAVIYGSARIWYPPNLTMDEYACIGPQAIIYAMGRIHLGRHSLVSQGAYLCGGTHDIDDPAFPLRTFPITIGAEAWIAAEAFVGPGVTVGEGAVLGARGVTVKNLEPWSVYAGNPCRKLRDRVRVRISAGVIPRL